jgi:hypothetical protein
VHSDCVPDGRRRRRSAPPLCARSIPAVTRGCADTEQFLRASKTGRGFGRSAVAPPVSQAPKEPVAVPAPPPPPPPALAGAEPGVAVPRAPPGAPLAVVPSVDISAHAGLLGLAGYARRPRPCPLPVDRSARMQSLGLVPGGARFRKCSRRRGSGSAPAHGGAAASRGTSSRRVTADMPRRKVCGNAFPPSRRMCGPAGFRHLLCCPRWVLYSGRALSDHGGGGGRAQIQMILLIALNAPPRALTGTDARPPTEGSRSLRSLCARSELPAPSVELAREALNVLGFLADASAECRTALLGVAAPALAPTVPPPPGYTSCPGIAVGLGTARAPHRAQPHCLLQRANVLTEGQAAAGRRFRAGLALSVLTGNLPQWRPWPCPRRAPAGAT